MIHTVTIGGRETELRCDINVLAELQRRYGALERIEDAIQTLAEIREIAALMVNEANWAAGRRELVTARVIGRDLSLDETHELQTGCLLALYDCIWPGRSMQKAEDGTEPPENPEEPPKKLTPGRAEH